MILWLLACASGPRELPTCSVTPPDPGVLRAEGTRLLDGQDREIILRGVNAGGRSKFAPYLPFDTGTLDEYLDRAQSWGVNVLRVPFTWAALEPTRGQDDAAWLASFDALLDGAWSRGMWTIVDAHQDIYGEMFCGDGFPLWTLEGAESQGHDCPDWFYSYVFGDAEVDAAFDAFWADEGGVQQDFAAMWTRMASHQRDRPGVIGYEILNEPHNGNAELSAWKTTTLPDFYEQLIPVIQAADPDGLVFFDATGLDAIRGTTILPRPAGQNLVFAPHYYDPAVFAGGDEFAADVTEALSGWSALGEAWDMPVLLGEYGVQPEAEIAEEYGREHQDALDTLHMHGTWWEYSVATELWNGENLSLVEGDGRENTVLTDAVARPYPRAIAGSDAVWSFDGEIFAMSYTPAAEGVSELSWPARWGEPVVEGTGACAQVSDGRVLVRSDRRAERVELTIRSR